MGEPGSCSDGWGYAQQIFNPILLMGWAVFPPHCLAWGQTVVGLLVVMVTSFKKTYAHTVLFSGSDPTAGHCQPMLLPETPGPSHASLVQSLMGTLLLSPGFRCPSKSVSRVLWKFCNQIPLASKIKFLGVFSPFAGSPGWKYIVGPRTFLTVWKFFCIIILQFVSHLLGDSMVGLIARWELSLYLFDESLVYLFQNT